ncbi:hypothetical protein LTR12_003713 [Friedmanniomyces endolithicus]|nr:hypothetical protein LTR12_003713 [Friedmanniomyces endolithicus]
MCSALRARPLTDAARFAAYVRSTWDSHTVHMLGRICEIVDLQTVDDLMGKMMHLASHLMSIPDGASHALRTVVWLKSHVTRCNVAFTKADVIRWPREADTLFDQLLMQPRPKDKPIQFYDCATPRRELWHAYNSARCRSIAQTRARQLASPAGIPPCFPISSERMLYVLDIYAHREIEGKVWLAVGTHLPEELTEEVFQYVLAAEEIPLVTYIRNEDKTLHRAKKRVVEVARDAPRDIYNFCISTFIRLYIANSTVTALEIAARPGAGRTSVLKVPVHERYTIPNAVTHHTSPDAMTLLSMLRPRWTIKYALAAIALTSFAVYTVLDMPLLSNRLPQYTGEYKVGTIDIEVPVERQRLSEAVFKHGRKPAFELETVLFSLYYPAVKDARSRKPKHLWFPKPIALQAEGYAKLAKVSNFFTNRIFALGLWTLAGSLTIPAAVDVPIVGTVKNYRDYETEHPIDDYGLPEYPVIVFSHGFASSRTDYTQYCGELASRGFVVATIEHRDGSGPGSLVMRDGTTTKRSVNSASELDPSPDNPALKVTQLAFREAEIIETVRVLRQINDGLGNNVFKTNARKEGKDLPEWRGRLNLGRVVIAGHSYGATGAMQALKGGHVYARPFVGGIILDPGKSSGPLNEDIRVPLLIINSESWSKISSDFYGRPHFDVVRDIARKVLDESHIYAWFVTSKGTAHPSVTDAPLIEPFLLSWTTGSTIDVKEGLRQYVKATEEFMLYLKDGHRRGILSEEVTHPEYEHDIRDEVSKASMPKEIDEYWRIHVAPSTGCAYPGMCGVDHDHAARPPW